MNGYGITHTIENNSATENADNGIVSFFLTDGSRSSAELSENTVYKSLPIKKIPVNYSIHSQNYITL